MKSLPCVFNLISIKKVFIMKFENSLTFAQSLDKKDQLAKYRDQFHFPKHKEETHFIFKKHEEEADSISKHKEEADLISKHKEET